MKSLQNKIFMSVLLFLIVPFCLTFLLLNRPLEKKIEEKLGNASQDSLNIAVANINDTLENMMDSITAITLDSSMISLLKQPELYGRYDKIRIADNIIRTLNNTYLFKMESNLTIMDWKGNLYTSWYTRDKEYDDFTRESWYRQLTSSKANFVWMHEINYNNGIPMVSVARLIQSSEYYDAFGVAVISVPEEQLWKIFESLGGETLIVDQINMVKTPSNVNQIYQNAVGELFDQKVSSTVKGQRISMINGTKMIINYNTMEKTDWKVVQFIPYDEVFQEIFAIRRLSIFIVLAIFVVFLLISFSISNRISKPLTLLRKKMVRIGEGEFTTIVSVKGSDEVSDLIRTYNLMIENIKGLLQKVKEEHEKKEEMRFKVLQSQINPHFILNTLNNIKWMAMIRNDQEVGEMISCLAVIMEESIGRSGHIITLEQEIKYIDNYLQLQKIKFNEKISIAYDIPQQLLKCEIIKFILQPIVENSVYHGMNKLKRKCRIEVSAIREKNEVIITVKDNGVGMSGAKQEEVARLLAEAEISKASSSIGLNNVQQRIKLNYGSEQGLSLISEENQGTTVRITIPFREWEGV